MFHVEQSKPRLDADIPPNKYPPGSILSRINGQLPCHITFTTEETARVIRRLVTAGFSTGVIYKILRQWDVPDEALAALENLEENPHEE